MTTNLPEAVNAGDEVEVQLAPRGAYPQIVDGEEVMQIVDDAAINALIDNFNAEKEAAKAKGQNYQVLVDADHSSETGSNTAAMAWVDRLFADPDRGLVGVFVFTKEGADAVTGKKWRFISPAWTLTEDGHPDKLVSVGMTNKPNLPVSPMLNMRAVRNPKAGTAVPNAGTDGVTPKPGKANGRPEGGGDGAGEGGTASADNGGVVPKKETADNGEVTTTQNKEGTDMNIREKLGLPAEATDEEVEAAIDALISKCAGMEQVQNALGLEPTCSNEDTVEALNAVLEQSEALQNADTDLQAANEQIAEFEAARRNAEADELVRENAEVIPEESVEEVKETYNADPEAAKQMVANMRKAYDRGVAINKRAINRAPVARAFNPAMARKPVALNMEGALASCGGDPAKENEMLRQMAKR